MLKVEPNKYFNIEMANKALPERKPQICRQLLRIEDPKVSQGWRQETPVHNSLNC